ncbi:claudin-8 [Alosa pseudoharengus]|uniref:claudin-8 n=1 Tax=Alosa pseudoharengus TaxID=34774 RepID=UPI003F8C07FD
MAYSAPGSYVDKSYMDRSYGKSYGGSAYTGAYDEKAAKAEGETIYEQQLAMEKKKRQDALCCDVVALVIGFIGLIGVAAVTGLPMWKVTAFIQENIIVMETRWEGLWMNCYRQANIRMQCKVYDSLLFLPPDLQAARGLMCASVALSTFAFVVSAVGLRCTKLVDSRPRTKHIVLVTGGCLYLMGCITTIIPVSWTGHVIIQDFYNPLLIDAQRRELGEALYIGWVTSALLFSAGVILLCRHAPRSNEEEDPSQVIYRAGSAYGNYQPYTYQPYSYQPPGYYQPNYGAPQPNYAAPPPGSMVYTPVQYT